MVLLSVKEVICLSFIKSGVRHQRTGQVRGHLRLGRIEKGLAVNLIKHLNPMACGILRRRLGL